MNATVKNGEVIIKFSDEEALVLLEWLHNMNEQEHKSLFQDQAEERILFDLEAALEEVILVTFEGNYIDTLSKARTRVRDNLDL